MTPKTVHFRFLLILALVFAPLLAQAQSQSQPSQKLDIPYKAKNERNSLYLDLYYPTKTSGKLLPTVIYTHGGGWAAGKKENAKAGSMRMVVEGMNDKGFCVAAVQYRLYSKNGTVTIKDCVTDCKDAVRYLAKNSKELSIDPQRLFTFGDSAGGQLAQMLLLTDPDLFPGDPDLAGQNYRMLGGVSWYGPCDFEKTELFNHDGRPDFRDRFGPRILPSGYDPKDKLNLYREMSPITYLSADSPSLLMIQGNKDTTIPVHHAHYMKEKADAIGAPVDILIIKNAGHNWRKVDAPIEPTREVLIQRTIEFITERLADQ